MRDFARLLGSATLAIGAAAGVILILFSLSQMEGGEPGAALLMAIMVSLTAGFYGALLHLLANIDEKLDRIAPPPKKADPKPAFDPFDQV